MKAAYIHIPFCAQICHYCDFNKVFLQGQPVEDYLMMLKKEFVLYQEQYSFSSLNTMFVGGGTPTALNERQLEMLCTSIRDIFPFGEGEFTFEANPGDLSKEKLRILADHGVNRLSFGVQSFNDQLLQAIGRTHRVKDVYQSIELAQQVGFDNISIDLMYALPNQTLEDFFITVKEALALHLPHYSGYSLIVEPKTVFYNLLRKGKLKLPSEDAEADMYKILREEMANQGLYQYEISNFSLPGYESRHNLVYWNNEQYFGFGAGAHGYIDGKRYSNYGPIKKYIEPLRQGKLPIFEQHVVTKQEMWEEEMFLGLRKTAGVSISHFKEKFSEDPLDIFQKQVSEMIKKGLLQVDGDFIQLTKKGHFLGNEVFQSFLIAE